MKKIILSFLIVFGIATYSEMSSIREVTGTFKNTSETTNATTYTTTTTTESTTSNTDDISTTSTETTGNVQRVYEYRPAILAEIDRQIAIPGNRGNLRNLYAQYDRELRAYLESINYDSDTIFFLANQYMMMYNYERANYIFSMDSKDLKNVFGAATTYRFMGKNQEAVAKYNEAISLNSSFAENYLGRALANRNMDNYDSAISDLRRYISMTSSSEGYAALGDIYFKLGRGKDAYDIVADGLGKHPNSEILKTLMRNISKNGVNN